MARAGTGIDGAFVEDFVARWEAVWNSQGPMRSVELMTEEICTTAPPGRPRRVDFGDVRAFLDSCDGRFPLVELSMTEGPFLRPGAPTAAAFWRGADRLGTQPPAGSRAEKLTRHSAGCGRARGFAADRSPWHARASSA
jgi:hypothetical protein